MKFFVVDDEKEGRELITILLLSMFPSAVILGAANGIEARDKLAKMAPNVPDVIFSDFQMSGLSGLGLLHFVRDHRVLRGIPFLLISGIPNPRTLKENILGYDRTWFLSRPFDIGEFRRLVLEILK